MIFDLPSLRAFATAADLGGFGRAAHHLHRTPGAISQQMKALEERVGQPLFLRNGKRQQLSAAGETLLIYARRILEVNDEAVLALKGMDVTGEVRFGMIQDLADSWLPYTLGTFARSCPAVHISLRVASSNELRRAVGCGELDLAVIFGPLGAPGPAPLAQLPVTWWGASSVPAPVDGAIPLLFLDPPCTFRDMAISALERANIPGRVVLSSGSVSALWAAAAAGLGFTARTGIHVHRGISPADTAIGLPELPMVELSLYHADRFGHPAVAHFARIVRETVQRHIADLSAVASPRLGELQDSSSATST